MSGKWFNRVNMLKSGIEYSSATITDESWNYFVPTDCYNVLKESKLKNGIYNLCIPSYLNGKEQLIDIISFEPYGYTFVSRESWLTINKTIQIKNRVDCRVVKVSSEKQKQDFIECFNKAYSSPISDMSVYGELSNDYAFSMQEFDFLSSELDGYLLVVENTVVSCCLVCNFSKYSGIYALGTDPVYQGKGYGKYLMSYLTNQCLENNQQIFLQTESDSKVEEMYLNMGFYKLFSCDYYKKG